ncbi:MAG TPA: hypothetical protein VM532_05320, partial [Burkholderiales bacterium]|nr:hypothetical protein [Burkholderiales bacterium]
NGMYIPNIPITLNSFTLDTNTCLGTGSITIGPNPPKPHVFMLTSQGKEIHIIDASGAHTSLGIAKKM